jgi:hypothetical protein
MINLHGSINDTMLVFADDMKIHNRNKICSKFIYMKEVWETCGEDNIDIPNRSERMDPVLKLYIGCTLMIPTNMDVHSGIANGTQVTLLKIVLKSGTQVRKVCIEEALQINAVFASDVDHILLKHTNTRILPSTFKISPKRTTFTIKVKKSSYLYNKVRNEDGSICPMLAKQLPVIHNNATTGHKLQGRSIAKLFIHQWNYTTNWPYVLLSRVTSISGLYLREPLKEDLSKFSVPKALQNMIIKMETNLKPTDLTEQQYEDLKNS